MPGPLRQDVEMLNNSLAGMGQAFEQTREHKAQEAIRQQMLDAEIERFKKSTEHEQRMESKQDALSQQMQTRMDMQDKQEFFKDILAANAAGEIKDIDGVNKWLSTDPHFAATGLQIKPVTNKLPPQAGQSAVAAAIQHAEEWRQKAAAEPDPTNKAVYQGYADALNKWINNTANPPPKVNTADYDTETTIYPPAEVKPEVPGSGGFLGFGGTPATPAVMSPERRVVRKIPHPPTAATNAPASLAPAQALGAPPAPGAAIAPQKKVLDPDTARVYLQKANGDKAAARKMAIADGYSLQ